MKNRVAIQGLRGSFHHEAASHLFGKEVELVECETFQEVSKAVVDGVAEKGIMAIENSLAGCILPNYTLLRKESVEVIGEVGLRVKLNLMALNDSSEEMMEEVHSHQMAIRQCGSFFSQYPDMKVVEAFDTAGSAKYIQDHKLSHVGAIASELAAEVYGLKILKEGIEDHDLNYTRFLVLQRQGGEKVESPDRASVYFQTKNDPGSLAQTLSIISALGINVGKLQSHPVPSKNSLYGFYATLEMEDLVQLDELESLMERIALRFEILGVYKKGEIHG